MERFVEGKLFAFPNVYDISKMQDNKRARGCKSQTINPRDPTSISVDCIPSPIQTNPLQLCASSNKGRVANDLTNLLISRFESPEIVGYDQHMS